MAHSKTIVMCQLLLLLLLLSAHRTCAHPLLAPTGTRKVFLSTVLETDHVLRFSTAVVTPFMLTANTCCAAAGGPCTHATNSTASNHASVLLQAQVQNMPTYVVRGND
jgi:hypothetical protein